MVEVTRSGFTESTHSGVAVLINSSGETLQEWGNSNTLIYPRSALKPIQTLNLYKDGVAKALGFSDNLIALTTASHHAENIHQKMINNWLKKMNLKEKHLSCGPSWPWNIKDQFKAIVLNQSGEKFSREIKILDKSFFKVGNVLVKVDYSGLNYKDALILKNGGKLVKEYPHIPGVDFSGKVIESDSLDFKSGDDVVLTGCKVGEIYPGGYSQFVKIKNNLLATFKIITI